MGKEMGLSKDMCGVGFGCVCSVWVEMFVCFLLCAVCALFVLFVCLWVGSIVFVVCVDVRKVEIGW